MSFDESGGIGGRLSRLLTDFCNLSRDYRSFINFEYNDAASFLYSAEIKIESAKLSYNNFLMNNAVEELWEKIDMRVR